MQVALPLNEMTVAEKLQTIEILWDDLSRNPEDIPLPSWHAEVLAERERLIAEGRAKFVPFDEFRQRILEETQ